MNFKKTSLLFVAGMAGAMLVSCTPKTTYYNIKFFNDDGTLLQESKVEKDKMPEYKGNDPVKDATAEYTYTFSGWSPELAPATKDASYTATYSSTKNSYTIKFVNYDGEELSSQSYEYGAMPEYTGNDPEKAPTVDTVYEFSGWTPEVVRVTGNATYTATFTSSTRKYTVTFADCNLDPVEVEYNQTLEEPEDPEKAATEDYVYFFTGWTLNGEPYDFDSKITGDIVLNANWEAVSAKEHGNRCTYIHYPEKEATYLEAGHAEFWYCELHKNYLAEEPTVGTIEEAEEDFEGTVPEGIEVYPVLEGGDKYLTIDVGGDDTKDKAALWTKDRYEDILGITFKARISGGRKDESKTPWIGFTFDADHTLYNNPVFASDKYVFDNHWRVYSISVDLKNGPANFVYAKGEFAEGSKLDIDNISITYADGTAFENFDGEESLFEFDEDVAKYNAVRKDNTFFRINIETDKQNTGDNALGFSIKKYDSISKVSYKMRVTAETPDVDDHGTPKWAGIGVANNHDLYTNMRTASYLFDGEWHSYNASYTLESGFVNLIHNSGQFFAGTTLDFDDIEITYEDGTVVDSFEEAFIFTGTFEYVQTKDARYAQFAYLESEEILPPTNCFARINLSTMQSSSPLYSNEMFTNITNIQFDYRLTTKKNAWWGFGISTYVEPTCYDTDPGHVDWKVMPGNGNADGQWHREVSLAMNGGTGRFKFVFAANEFDATGSTMDLDNIIITYDNGKTAVFDFLGDMPIKTTASFIPEEPEEPEVLVDCYARINLSTNESLSPFVSVDQFEDISNITFDYRLTTTKNSWWGFGVSTKDNPNVYDSGCNVCWKTISGNGTPDGEWHQGSINITGTGRFVFIFAAGEFDSSDSTLDLDNIVLTYNSGETVTFDFTDVSKFNVKTNLVTFIPQE